MALCGVIPCSTTVWRPSAAAEALYVQRKEQIDRQMRDLSSRDATPYECFLQTFGSLPLKHPLKHEFLILCWQQQWPDFLQIERNGVLNHWLVRKARGFCFFNRVNLMGSGSSGKTNDAAAYIYTAWKAKPFDTSAFLSTTSAEAGESRTWGAVKDFHKADQFKVGKRIESLHLITLDEEIRDEDGVKERDFRDVIKCVNIKAGAEGKNVMAAIVGRKNTHVIWVCDELPFMDLGVLNARVNLNTNPFNQFIGLGNAPEEGDPMYIDSEPHGPKHPDGWRSVDKDRDESWPTRAGHCLYFNGAKSPNFSAATKSFPFPKLMNEQFRLQILQDSGGEDTPMYWKQFYGFPPTVDISDKVLTHKLLESNEAFEQPEWTDPVQKVLAGLDLGFREDGDPCVIQFGKLGRNTKARTILALEADGVALTPKQGDKSAFEQQIASRVVEECRKRNCHDIAADVTGDGGIMVQAIEREARAQSYVLNVLAVSFSGTAEDKVIIPGEKRTARESYANMVSQLWVSFRQSVLNRVIYGMQPRSNCTGQLCARRFNTDAKKKYLVEPKREMKKRLRRSPDHADAACLTHHLALRHGLSGQQVEQKKPPFNPETILRPQERKHYAGHGQPRYAR